MSLSSMTGFARVSGTHGTLHWQWEARSVNGKALDVRCRLPVGCESLEVSVREVAARHLKRGNIQVSLACEDPSAGEPLTINETALAQIIAIAEPLRQRLGGEPLRIDTLLQLRGVVEQRPPLIDEAALARRDEALRGGLEPLFRALAAMRQAEGQKLQAITEAQLARIEALSAAARDNPARTIEAVKARLAEQVARLIDSSTSFEPERLHQEAVLLASRADIQEELDRLGAHVAAARALIASPEPAGRKFDFLTQEFNREANTLCSKAAHVSLTAIGLELKTVIDQLREQVANIE